jgi:hypothetical protein
MVKKRIDSAVERASQSPKTPEEVGSRNAKSSQQVLVKLQL